MARFDNLLGAAQEWARPGPSALERRQDVWIALAFAALAALGSELLRSIGVSAGNPVSPIEQYAAIVSGVVLLVWRRSHPVVVTAAATGHLLIVGSMVPMVVASLPMQVVYFMAIYSGVAWAKDRRIAAYIVVGVSIAMFVWLAWFFALSSGISELISEAASEGQGPIPATVGVAGWVILNNVLFFGGAVLLGQVDWKGAYRSAEVSEQASTIAVQGELLRDQAVVAERLRIARELHDVVAHHISVMGVQAAAARRVLYTDFGAAGAALTAIESSSRDAVTQMRDLLGTLRRGEPEVGARTERVDRSPQPSLGDLVGLVAESATPVWTATLRWVPNDPALMAFVAAPVQLSIYRITQEALANVRRHSTASSVTVAVRIEAASNRIEVEIVNGGSARRGTAGTGLGQLGMAERARLLGGGLEIGARRGGGYRVRAWFPMDAVPQRADSRIVEPVAR